MFLSWNLPRMAFRMSLRGNHRHKCHGLHIILEYTLSVCLSMSHTLYVNLDLLAQVVFVSLHCKVTLFLPLIS